jgi:hypothetical protein
VSASHQAGRSVGGTRDQKGLATPQDGIWQDLVILPIAARTAAGQEVGQPCVPGGRFLPDLQDGEAQGSREVHLCQSSSPGEGPP